MLIGASTAIEPSIASLWSSIPSPSSGALKIGSLQLRAYGLMIALGVIVAVRWTGRRFRAVGIGDGEVVSAMAVWAVTAGVIGARLYHVATEWERFADSPGDIVKIWEGGLGVPGGILLGTLTAIWYFRKHDIPVGLALWCAAPGIAIAQSIGRWGNWWNQELFGRPTGLPWGLEIDADKAVAAGYAPGTLFHPTFLYESLWNLALACVLALLGRRLVSRRPERLLACYAIGYGIGRFWIEGLRIDPAKEGGGLRLNQWTAIVLIVGGIAFLVYARRRRSASPSSAGGDVGDSEVPSAT